MQSYIKKKDIVFNELKQKIVSGQYPSGYRFPSEPALAKQFKVGRVTLRSALKRLEDASLLVRVPSKGTFVNDLSKNDSRNIRCIWILQSNHPERYYPQHYILPGIEQQAVKLDISTQLMDTYSVSRFSDSQIEELRKSEKLPDGVILVDSTFHGDERIIKVLHKFGCPVVIPHGYKSDYQFTNFAVMAVSNKNAVISSLSYLKQKGHFRVAVLGLKDGSGNLRLRGFGKYDYLDKTPKAAFFKTLEGLGLSTAPSLLSFAEYSSNSVKESLKEWFEMDFPPTAILAYSDYMAELLTYELNKAGISIPEQVAIMGIGGMPQLQYLEPAVSTLDFGYQGIGVKAVELLANSGEWFHPEKSNYAPPFIETPCRITERESTMINRFENAFA